MPATNFTGASYVAALQTLLDRHNIDVTVQGFRPGRQLDKLEAPVAELQIDGFEIDRTFPRALDGVLRASLLVMLRSTETTSEEDCFELAINIATALHDESEQAQIAGGGPITISSIEPEYPDGALQHRVASFSVSYEQQWSLSRTVQPTEPAAPTDLWVSREPETGIDHEEDYDLLVDDGEPF